MKNNSLSRLLGVCLLLVGIGVFIGPSLALAQQCGTFDLSDCNRTAPPCQSPCSNGIRIVPTPGTTYYQCSPPGSETGGECTNTSTICGTILTYTTTDCVGDAVLSNATRCLCGSTSP